MTSAGTGISHAEYANGDSDIHFLQIWALPHVAGLTLAYYTRHFTDAEKKDKWVLVIAPIDDPSINAEREVEHCFNLTWHHTFIYHTQRAYEAIHSHHPNQWVQPRVC